MLNIFLHFIQYIFLVYFIYSGVYLLICHLGSKEIKPVNLKGSQPWIFIGKTDAEAEASILWTPDANNWLIGKDPDAGKDEGRRRRGQQRIGQLDGITNSLDMNLGKL